ncbi:MAG: tail fiber domain-containing protein, partial [Pseudobdellovibrio sp.]|nr:tail fiber domain-containing protein [Pseudobdellovibrio sp.]
VGIGTSAPISLLHLSQNSAQLRVETSSTSTTGNAPIYLVNQDTTANNVLDIYFATRDNGLEPDNGAIIRSVFTNRSASGVTADLAFLTANDAENPIERMRLNSSGYLGIGTTTPNRKLEVWGSASVAAFNTSASDHGYIEFYAEAANPTSRSAYIGYPSAGSKVLNIYSQYASGSVQLQNTAGSLILANTGNVGIGTTNPGYKLDVSGTINIASGSALAFGGTSVCTAAGCTSSSDERLKENIKPLDFDLNKLLSLNAVQYDWKNKAKYGDKHQIGFIAQNLEKVYPEVVYTDKTTGLKSVTYGHLVAPVIEALKSLYKRIVGVEEHNVAQDRQIASIVESKADKAEIEVLKQKAAEVDDLKAENAAKAKEIDALKSYLCSKDPAAPICK